MKFGTMAAAFAIGCVSMTSNAEAAVTWLRCEGDVSSLTVMNDGTTKEKISHKFIQFHIDDVAKQIAFEGSFGCSARSCSAPHDAYFQDEEVGSYFKMNGESAEFGPVGYASQITFHINRYTGLATTIVAENPNQGTNAAWNLATWGGQFKCEIANQKLF